MSITLEQVTKRYQGQPVVNDVSLHVPEGEFFVLLGPSGSGKSTLLRAIAGLAEIDQGSITLHGTDVTRVGARERGVGFVFQHYALFRHLSIADNIEFALRVRRMKAADRRARRRELLKLVALEGMDERLPSQLSGGQQQRVAVARALAHKPQVLLLDEPFGALDAKIREELRGTIRRVQQELGITTVLVTHDQEEAFALADRIGVMNLGRLLEVGDPHQLYARPSTRFVATFLGAANLLLARLGPEGLRVGDVVVDGAGRQGAPPPREHEVVAVLRPEEIELAADAGRLRSPCLGHAIVEDLQFTGASERLRLRVRDEGLSAQVGSGRQESAWLDVTRTQPERRALLLARGAEVAVGARRLHVLPTPLSSFTVCDDDPVRADALLHQPLLAELAARMKTRVALCPEAGSLPQGVVAISQGPEAASTAARLLRAGANEVLLLGTRTGLPRQVCACWSGTAARHATLAVTASLLRHLPGEAVCLALSAEGRRDPQRNAALRALLDARAEAKADHGLEMRTELVPAADLAALGDHLARYESPLLVLGITRPEAASALLAMPAMRDSGLPVLLVYREERP